MALLIFLLQGSSIVKRDLSAVWREANTTLHPSLLLGLVHGDRRKRNADGKLSFMLLELV